MSMMSPRNPVGLPRAQVTQDVLTGDLQVVIRYGSTSSPDYVALKIKEHHAVESAFGYWIKRSRIELRRAVLTDLHNQIAEQLALLALED